MLFEPQAVSGASEACRGFFVCQHWMSFYCFRQSAVSQLCFGSYHHLLHHLLHWSSSRRLSMVMLSTREKFHLWSHRPLTYQPYLLSWVRHLLTRLRLDLVHHFPFHHRLLRSHHYYLSTLPLPGRCWKATPKAMDQWCYQHQPASTSWAHMLRS